MPAMELGDFAHIAAVCICQNPRSWMHNTWASVLYQDRRGFYLIKELLFIRFLRDIIKYVVEGRKAGSRLVS